MEKSKIFSIRVPESLAQKLDNAVIQHHYWKRNAFIIKAMEAFLYCADSRTQRDILQYWRYGVKKGVLEFTTKKREDI